MKKIYEKINKNKEEIKINIQKIFTKIRTELNNREDELLLDVDKKFDDIFFQEELIKRSEKLPNKIKISLEKSKIINDDLKNDKLFLLINESINVENNINEIKNINENIIKYKNSEDLNIKFTPMKEEDINEYLKNIKNFGKVEKISDNSLICVEENEIRFITEFIKMIKPNSKLKLIYRASVDGQMGKDFHSRCDNIFPTLSLFKTKSNKKFGGYTESNWKITTYPSDPNAYIFSINKKKYYKVNNNIQYSIYSLNGRGPNFDGLWLCEPFFVKDKFWETIGDHKCFPKGSDNEITEEYSITLSELEVFKII